MGVPVLNFDDFEAKFGVTNKKNYSGFSYDSRLLTNNRKIH